MSRHGSKGPPRGRARRPRARTDPSPEGVAVVGRRPVQEALSSGLATQVVVAVGARGLQELLRLAEDAGTPVLRVPAEELDRLAAGQRHQGVAARLRPVPELTEADLAQHAWGERAVVLVLDGVTDPHNVGAAARTAEAAGAEALILRRRRGAAPTAAAVRASAGALLHLPVARVPNLTRALGLLQKAGFWAVGLDAGSGRLIAEAEPPPGRVALVLGAEGPGLSRLVRESCDELVAIPLAGRVSSLNVSVAAGVALYAYLGVPRKEGI